MADLYTDLYVQSDTQNTTAGAITTTTDTFYIGPNGTHKGEVITRRATYTGLIANADVLHIAGGLMEGESLVSWDCSMSADPDTDNTGEVDVGITSDPNGILAASTAFRAGADVNVEASGQAIPGLVAASGDEFLLTMTTDEHEVSVTYVFTIVTSI